MGISMDICMDISKDIPMDVSMDIPIDTFMDMSMDTSMDISMTYSNYQMVRDQDRYPPPRNIDFYKGNPQPISKSSPHTPPSDSVE